MQQPHTFSLVPYQTPQARAVQATGNAAIGIFAAMGVAVIPILIKFLATPDYTKTGLTALATVVGSALLGVLLVYFVKLAQAHGSDIPPSVTPGQPVAPPAMLPALPLVDPALLVGLVNAELRASLAAKQPPAPAP